MVLAENLKKNNIIVKAKAKNRWDLIEEMVDLAVKNKEILEEEKEVVKKALVEREKSMSTGIGNGVAIPHCTTAKVENIIIIMAVTQKGIDFEAIDNNPVKIAILLLVPKNKLTQHIKTLANIAKMMSDEKLREKLLTLKTSDSIIKALKKSNI
ncbi:MAG: PTS sugar transporter subunit IIA [bacterium]|nr:PTS sugar transporter subunit IIA [bacterium]